MKGTNTIIVNDEQMNDIVQKWWDGMTYGTKDKVICVYGDSDNFNFCIELQEIKPVKTNDSEDI